MNILIPTDFSSNSFHATKYALETFGRENNYMIFHSVHVPQAGAAAVTGLHEEMRHIAEAEMENFIAGLLKIFKDYDLDPAIEFGDLVETSAKTVEEDSIDIVVIGTHGASGLKKIFLGSNAQSIARKSPKTTLIVPYNAVLSRPKTILLATDFHNDNYLPSVQTLVELCKYFECKLSLLHISTSDESEEELLDPVPELNLLSDIDHSLSYVFSDDVEDAILQFSQENDVDMIAVVPHHETFLQRIFHTSISKQLSFHSDIPLLILRGDS